MSSGLRRYPTKCYSEFPQSYSLVTLLRNDRAGTDSGLWHRCVGQFHRVSAHIHRTADCSDSVWRTVRNISCCSVICLLPEAFAVDQTSKQTPCNPCLHIPTQSFFIPFHLNKHIAYLNVYTLYIIPSGLQCKEAP